MPSFDKSRSLRNATPEQLEELAKRLSSIAESVQLKQAGWVESHHFPPDITRAVRLTMADLFGDFVSADEIGEYGMSKVWELLQTAVDRREWLTKIDKPADNSAMLVQPATPPTLPFRLHLCDVPQTLKRDGFKEVITLQNEDYWKLMQSLMAAYPNAVRKSKLNQLFRFPNDRKNHPKKLRDIIDALGLTVQNWTLTDAKP